MSFRQWAIGWYLKRFRLVRDVARWSFRRYADRNAFVTQSGERLSFGDLGRRIYALAEGLLKLGLQPGDRVAFLLPNCFEFVEVRLACHEAGLVAAPLVWDMSPESRRRALEQTGARVYIHDPSLDSGADELASRGIAGLRCIPVSEGNRSGLDGVSVPGAGPCRVAIDPAGPATINFTSGTTGEPRGVVSTHAAWMASLRMTMGASRLAPGRREVMLHAIPFATAGWGAIPACLLGGVTGLLMRRFDPAAALDMVERERAARAFLTPSQIIDWLDEPSLGSRDLSSLRSLIYATAPLHGPKTREALKRFGPILQQGYGLAEVLPPVALLWPEEHDPDGHPFRAGSIVPPCRVRIAGKDGRETDMGERGDIRVWSPTRTPGYWERPDLTKAALDGEFFRTGDIGFWDEAGFLNVVGRAVETVSGFDLHPREVEELAHAHPAIKECALVEAGKRVVLAYSARRGGQLSEEELERFLAERLPKGAAPARCARFDGDLPRNAAGKIVRRYVRAAIEGREG